MPKSSFVPDGRGGWKKGKVEEDALVMLQGQGDSSGSHVGKTVTPAMKRLIGQTARIIDLGKTEYKDGHTTREALVEVDNQPVAWPSGWWILCDAELEAMMSMPSPRSSEQDAIDDDDLAGDSCEDLGCDVAGESFDEIFQRTKRLAKEHFAASREESHRETPSEHVVPVTVVNDEIEVWSTPIRNDVEPEEEPEQATPEEAAHATAPELEVAASSAEPGTPPEDSSATLDAPEETMAQGSTPEGACSEATEAGMLESHPEEEAAGAEDPCRGFDFRERVYTCMVGNPGVAYRNTPKFSDRRLDLTGPKFPETVVATAICQGPDAIFMKCKSGQGWLPLVTPSVTGSKRCFQHRGITGEVTSDRIQALSDLTDHLWVFPPTTQPRIPPPIPDFDFQERIYQCLIESPGVGYRRSPAFKDKCRDTPGPKAPECIVATAMRQGDKMIYLKCKSGRGWLPLTTPNGKLKCFQHVGPPGSIRLDALQISQLSSTAWFTK
eukprot:TRINITY_DN44971_c0_g1_i1.p1 TRINITY_DN44971_c0_g1~~TRINITY_DN44971_c0_g1_i1.p1  ORF type:complete len:495 (+),score=84.61 TRINITY_DN44971_c0_g1_i1:159-1643(+)